MATRQARCIIPNDVNNVSESKAVQVPLELFIWSPINKFRNFKYSHIINSLNSSENHNNCLFFNEVMYRFFFTIICQSFVSATENARKYLRIVNVYIVYTHVILVAVPHTDCNTALMSIQMGISNAVSPDLTPPFYL